LCFIVGTITDALVLVREHQTEAIVCATVAPFILFRGLFFWSCFGSFYLLSLG
jgi:hypothetical protein